MEHDKERRTKEYGTLWLCATPIGNLEDMTYRAVRLMNEVELIAAEDTRHTRKLLARYDIHTNLTSYHEHNKSDKGKELIEHLKSGKDLLLVSDAGLPGIADPGSVLAREAIAEGIEVMALPGANAALSALIVSGLDTVRFSFVGFLPKTKQNRLEVLQEVKHHKETLIFYEAPHRLKETLEEIAAHLGENRRGVLCRELTKKFEEKVRASLSDLIETLKTKDARGEYVIVVEGASEDTQATLHEEKLSLQELVASFEEKGMTRKEAMREAAKKSGISRRDVYNALL